MVCTGHLCFDLLLRKIMSFNSQVQSRDSRCIHYCWLKNHENIQFAEQNAGLFLHKISMEDTS